MKYKCKYRKYRKSSLNFNKYKFLFQLDNNGNPIKISKKYQLKSSGNPVEDPIRYQLKSIQNPVEI